MPSTLPSTPALGYPVPDVRHAVSVQLPTWDDIKEMFTGAVRVKSVQKTGYPRSFIHQDTKELNKLCLDKFAPSSAACFLFSDLQYALECKRYITSSLIQKEDAIAPHLVVTRSISVVLLDNVADDINQHESNIVLHAVFCPAAQSKPPSDFWRLVGVGISSRLAEYCLKHLKQLEDVTGALTDTPHPTRWRDPNHREVCQRIVDLIHRAPISKPSKGTLARDDVYLFQTGMAAIYTAHDLLSRCFEGESVMFGFPYELTLKLLETYGPPVKFYPFGTSEEIDELEVFLADASHEERKIQAIWCEAASNPLLRTPDFSRLRALADRYQVVIVVDDTIGSFANVDLTNVADMIVTSLTKSFNGRADVMAGSLVLNPASPMYSQLKESLDSTYTNCIFERDTAQLALNSRDLLPRVARMNATASYLVRSLLPLVEHRTGLLTALYYPEICWSSANYRACMRSPTREFAPGYGGLFTLEFEDVEVAKVFFNALNVHKGPSLGASVTLAQPYVQTVFHSQKAWAAERGLHESIVRVSVGLEDKEALLEAFIDALAVAAAWKEEGSKSDKGRKVAADVVSNSTRIATALTRAGYDRDRETHVAAGKVVANRYIQLTSS